MMPRQMPPGMSGNPAMPMPSAMQMQQMGGGQQMRPNNVDTGKIQKQASKDNTPGPKRSKSLKSENKVKKDG